MSTLFILATLLYHCTAELTSGAVEGVEESTETILVPPSRTIGADYCGDKQILCDEPGFVRTFPNMGRGNGARGVVLEQYTNNTLGFIGCVGDGCLSNQFFCRNPNADSMQFGTTTDVMRAILGPQPFSWTPITCLNAPQRAVDATVLCQQLGYQEGLVEMSLSNRCPSTEWDTTDTQWMTDGIWRWRGYGKVYTCFNPCIFDADGDGILDDVDNCEFVANPSQCDYDGDGIGDACDPCVFASADASDQDDDGVPDACDKCPGGDDRVDTDGDGIPDDCDICPNSPDLDNYVDLDNDGVSDCRDNCVGIWNPVQLDSDNDGKGDLCDNCVRIPNPDQADFDNDQIGDVCDDDICCVYDDCTDVPDGNYQSCQSCNEFIQCWGGGTQLSIQSCATSDTFYDAKKNACVFASETCQDPMPMPSVPVCVYDVPP